MEETEAVERKQIPQMSRIVQETEESQCLCFTGKLGHFCKALQYCMIGRPEEIMTTEMKEVEDDRTVPYEPGKHRQIKFKTTDFETAIHLIKSMSGAGILSMPRAFYNAGLLVAVCVGLPLGFLCMYCSFMVVRTAQHLQRSERIPSLDYGKTCQLSCETCGSYMLYDFGKILRWIVNVSICINLLCICTSFVIYVAENVKQVVEVHVEEKYHIDVRLYMLMQYPVLLLLNSIRRLKFLTPISLLANVSVWVGLIFTFTYLLTDLPSITDCRLFPKENEFFLFLGKIIFSTSGCCLVLPLEEVMMHPSHMAGCPCSVINVSVPFVIFLYFLTGFFGFWKYGEDTRTSITLNIPIEDTFAQAIKLLISFGILMTYCILFYIPNSVAWSLLKHHFKDTRIGDNFEWILRYLLITATVLLAIVLLDFGVIVSLIGATLLPNVEMIIPACIHLMAFWSQENGGFLKWRILKTMLIVCLGIMGLCSGTFFAFLQLISYYENQNSNYTQSRRSRHVWPWRTEDG